MYNRNKINTYENQNFISLFSSFNRNLICPELSGSGFRKERTYSNLHGSLWRITKFPNGLGTQNSEYGRIGDLSV